MSAIADVLPRPSSGWLRLPGWRGLVLGLSLIGALLILTATYSLVGAREGKRLAAAAAADARLLALALADDAARARPLAGLVAETGVVVALGRVPGDRGLRAEAGRVLGVLARRLDLTGVALTRSGEVLAAAGLVPTGTAPLAAVAGVGGALRLVAAAPVGTGDVVAHVALAPAALPHAWAHVTGEAVITDRDGTIVASTVPAWQGRRLDALAGGEDEGIARIEGTRYRHESAPVGALGLTVHVLSPTAIVGARTREVMGLEIMVMSLLAAVAGFMDSRASRHAYESLSDDAESLRALNARLEAEIAERERVEAALEQASKLAALGQMSAAVAHELAQPLAATKTYLAGSRLLARTGREREAAESLDRVDAMVERMVAITRELKAFARKGGDPAERVDLREVARAAATTLTPYLAEVDATLCLDLGAEPAMARGDRHRLEQVLTNLIRNAADAVAGRERRRVSVILSRRLDTLRVVVEDTGPGVPLAERRRVFEPFHTTKPAGEGLGLGLTVAAGLAEHMGGRLFVEDARGSGGARFVLVLPRTETAPEAGS